MRLVGSSLAFESLARHRRDVRGQPTERRGPSHAPGIGESSVCSLRPGFSYVQTGTDNRAATWSRGFGHMHELGDSVPGSEHLS